MSRTLRLAYLSPTLVQAILEGSVPCLADHEGPAVAVPYGLETAGEEAPGSIPPGCFKGGIQSGLKHCFHLIITDADPHEGDIGIFGGTT